MTNIQYHSLPLAMTLLLSISSISIASEKGKSTAGEEKEGSQPSEPSLSKENAHSFLQQVSENGTTRTGDGLDYYWVKYFRGKDCESTIDFLPSKAVVEAYEYYPIQYKISWSRISESDIDWGPGPSHISIKGATAGKNSRQGEFNDSEIWIYFESDSLTKRAHKAIEFLRKSCDDSGKFGF